MVQKHFFPQLPLRGTLVCALFLSILTHRSHTIAADGLRTVALSGDEVPGLGPGVSIDFLGLVLPLGNGLVGFGARPIGPGITMSGPQRNDYAIWSESNAGLIKVVQRGDLAPGAAEGDVFGLRVYPINAQQAGMSAIWADFVGTAQNHGIWHHSLDGGLELVVLSGDPAPGFSDENIRIGRLRDFYAFPVANGRNQISFAGQYYGPGVNPGFNYGSWIREADGELRLVASSGDPIPGKSADFVMDGRFQDMRLSDTGRLALTAQIRQYDSPDRVGNFSRRNVLLSENGPGTLAVIALEGQQAAGVDDGAAFGTFSFPSGHLALNRRGKMVFGVDLTGANVTSLNARGLWTDRTGNGLTLFARAGDSAPGLNADQYWYGFGNLSINDRDEIAFSANYSAGDGIFGNGLWMEQQGRLQIVIREGDMLPGLPADTGFDYGQIRRPSKHPVAVLNAWLTGTGIDDANDLGIWARNAIGDLLLVAREGDLLNVSDDPRAPDLRMIKSLGLGGIDDWGYVSFRASFVDGTSGVFVSSVIAVPEPPAGVLLVLGLVLLSMLRARR